MASPTKFILPSLTRIPSVRRDEPQRPTERSDAGGGAVPKSASQESVSAPKDIRANVERAQKEQLPLLKIDPQNEKEFFILHAKQTLAAMIEVRIIGDQVARGEFAKYLEYLKKAPDQIQDFLTFSYGKDPGIHDNTVDVLNAETKYHRLSPIPVGSVRTGMSHAESIQEFTNRFRCPVLTAHTRDLLLLGITNPSLGRHLSGAIMEQFPEFAQAKIDFVILSQDEMTTACALNSSTSQADT